MEHAVIMNARDYKKVAAKLEDARKRPAESEKLIDEALYILKKKG